MAQFLRPDSNVTQSGFTGGFADIDESVASDTDFAFGANNTAAVLEVGVGNPTGTPASGTYTVRYRHARVNNGVLSGSGNGVDIIAEVVEGTTIIATDTTQATTGSWTTRTWSPNLSSISDWTNVRLRFTTSSSGGSPANRRGGAVSWAELEVPDSAASQTLEPSLVTNSQTFFASTIAQITNLTTSLVVNSQTFFGPTTTVGSVTISPSLFTNGQTFHGPTINRGIVELNPSLVTGSQTFFGSTISLVVILSPSLFTNSQTFYLPTVSTTGANQSLTPSLINNSQVFHNPTVSTQYELVASMSQNIQTFFSPSVSILGTQALVVELFYNEILLYGPQVSLVPRSSLRRGPIRGQAINAYKAKKKIKGGKVGY